MFPRSKPAWTPALRDFVTGPAIMEPVPAVCAARLHRLDLLSLSMEVSETIQCPYCGQSFDLVVDTSSPTQRFTTDCEVCCRPFEVATECEPGEVLSLEVHAA